MLKENLRLILEKNRELNDLEAKFDKEEVSLQSFFKGVTNYCDKLCFYLRELMDSCPSDHVIKYEFLELSIDYESLKQIAKWKFDDEKNKN